ncbi:MAG: cobalt transporter CbiM [Candidatus Limnocylindrales bacterium]
MHIPDGYLSPIVSVGLGVITVPTWAMATRRIKQVLNNRTVPLLAIFAAMSFTIMMFNVPVPGGTTAHGVGGTLIAIVLGPWAAVIAVSVALVIQALFFGDGGVLAIFTNCLNMAIILPFVGYFTYRLISGRAPILSTRRVWAAAIGSYVGITVAAFCVGVELGIEPIFFTQNGHPLYSPYTLQQAIPAMVAAHAFGASIVEALITGLGVAYFQQRHPEYLTSLRSVFAPDAVAAGEVSSRPLWQVILGAGIAAIVAMAALGLIIGGGNPSHFYGADWSTVSWPDVATMLLITAILGIVLVPLAHFVLPQRLKGVGAGFTLIAVIAPLGLIAPGFAYAEGSPGGIKAAFGYVPHGLQQLSGIFSAPFVGYNVPLPFFNSASAPLWHAGIGYEIAGIVGILVIGVVVLGLSRLLGAGASPGPDAVPDRTSGSPG